MKCYYHSADLDGHCAGAIVKYFYPDCELVPSNYGDKPPELVQSEDYIYIVDFSFPHIVMSIMANVAHLFWLDHHKSAIEEMSDLLINGVRDNTKSGCELAWSYLSSEPIPKAVSLLGRYDVWDHTNPEVLPFQYGMRLRPTDPQSNMGLWRILFEEPESLVPTILGEGQTILKYVKEDDRKYVTSCAFRSFLVLEGVVYKLLVVNKMLSNSSIFDSIYDPAEHDIMATFGRRNGVWNVSLYSLKPEINCGAIAKLWGGGGHQGAAGFSCDQLPFSLGGVNELL